VPTAPDRFESKAPATGLGVGTPEDGSGNLPPMKL